MYRRYQRTECITFRKTEEEFGGLSNMAGGYPIHLGDLVALSSEALYQASRFPHRADVQESILAQRSPMTAKMKSKPFRKDSRPDWERVRVKVMRWALRAKLYSNVGFRDLLLATGETMIVEESRKDRYWGAVPDGPELLVGENVLGRLLMELRDELRADQHRDGKILPPPDIDRFLFLRVSAPPVPCNWSRSELAGSGEYVRGSLPLSLAAHGQRDAEAEHATAGHPTVVVSDSDSEYRELVRQLSLLTRTEASEALRGIAASTPEFSPTEFRRILHQVATGKGTPLTQHAARILRVHEPLLLKLAQPSLL